ncbi:MAG: hypothetical protein LRY38_04715 [Aeromonadaceae bacterium]|nr:hypothetical protein [Aeromonadaceae bacterium]
MAQWQEAGLGLGQLVILDLQAGQGEIDEGLLFGREAAALPVLRQPCMSRR